MPAWSRLLPIARPLWGPVFLQRGEGAIGFIDAAWSIGRSAHSLVDLALLDLGS